MQTRFRQLTWTLALIWYAAAQGGCSLTPAEGQLTCDDAGGGCPTGWACFTVAMGGDGRCYSDTDAFPWPTDTGSAPDTKSDTTDDTGGTEGTSSDEGTGSESATSTEPTSSTETGTETGTGSDTGTGSTGDTGTGSTGDTGSDTGTGSTGDTGTGSTGDTGSDTGTGSTGDTGSDTGTGSTGDTGSDTGTGSDTDAGSDADSGSDTATPDGSSWEQAIVIEGSGQSWSGSWDAAADTYTSPNCGSGTGLIDVWFVVTLDPGQTVIVQSTSTPVPNVQILTAHDATICVAWSDKAKSISATNGMALARMYYIVVSRPNAGTDALSLTIAIN